MSQPPTKPIADPTSPPETAPPGGDAATTGAGAAHGRAPQGVAVVPARAVRPIPPPAPVAPVARRVLKVDIVHGERREDDYFWLREKADPEVAAYLEAENAYADEVLAPTEALQRALYDEMLARINETDVSAPYPERGYFYYTRTEQGRQYPFYCRKAGSLDAPEQVILDLNALAEGQAFMSLGTATVSDDGRYLAYSTDPTGFREYTLCVKDLETGEVLPLRVEKTVSVAWAADSRTLFYTVEDHAKRSWRLYRQRLGAGAHDLVYEEGDERFSVGVTRSRSGAYLFLMAGSHTTTEVRFADAAEPEGAWRLVAPREQDHEYELHHHGRHFYVRTNDRGRTFRVARAPVSDPRRENWEEVVAHRPEVMIEGLDFFARHCVMHELEDGLPHLRVVDLATGADHRMSFQESAYSLAASENAEFDTDVFRFQYQSLVTPASVYDYDMRTRVATLRKRTEVRGGFDPADYVCERLRVAAPDGTRVPVSLVYRREFVRDGSRPAHLYGYGSYGYALPIVFSSNRLSLLERGFVCAFAHVRGGGELGKPWHDQGRMRSKLNTFTDFIAVAEHLVAARYTSPDRLVIEGGSAGGLLVGAAANLRPDLFHAVVSKVPFVDVINSMLDESLPLTVGEFEEWGNPKERGDYEYMKRYCPYTNLKAGAYPAMLVKTAFNDSQVMYWEPAKYMARLRTLATDDAPRLLKTNMNAGHGGASGRYDFLREVALDYAFILWQAGVFRP
jgi:oligopeptidase B